MFPGQGSQKIGMGKDLYDNFPSARAVFQEIDDALGANLSRLIFCGSEEELKSTENAQPALMAVSVAGFHALKNDFLPEILDKTKFLAGHSLGEYTALCIGGVLSITDTARLLRIRGRAMAAACPQSGAMAAILGIDIDALELILEAENSNESIVQVANDNCTGQIVISGHRSAVEMVMKKSLKAGAKKAVLLEVSGPFHSKLMEPALEPIQSAMDSIKFHDTARPIISNVSARAEQDNFKDLLLQQLTSRIRWKECIEFAAKNGVAMAVEIGSGKVLTGLAKRIAAHIESHNVNSVESLEKFAESFISDGFCAQGYQ
jgi:[acyl-carrier-protein] S-malonyltransferase